MPFQSKAQMRYMFAKEPEVAKEFADKTSEKEMKNMPEKVKKPDSSTPESRRSAMASLAKGY
jgi:hypothetical protein